MNYESCAICHKAKTPICNHCTLFDKFEKSEWAKDFESEIRADERAKTIEEAEKLLDKIAPDKVAEIKCYDGEIRNRPLIDFAKVYEIFEQMKGED